MRIILGAVAASLLLAGAASAQPRAPMTRPADGKLPHVQVEVKAKQVRVECEAVIPDMPLEFFVCATNTQEHESLLRSSAKASHIHLALLMLGLEPGEPIKYNKAADKWIAPHGPPLQIRCEWQDNDKAVTVPAYRMMRNSKTKKEMPPTTWVFCGSRITEEGNYAADITGYLVSVVNFDFTLIDIPQIASNSNETLEWEVNPDACPKKGTKVWMIIEPAGDKGKGPATRAAAPAAEPTVVSIDVTLDEARIRALRQQWDKAMKPHRKELATAAQTHYEVIAALRKEQQRLIDESDRIQRVIDEIQKEWQDIVTPRPE